jgi:Flp pilus assembly protein TadD
MFASKLKRFFGAIFQNMGQLAKLCAGWCLLGQLMFLLPSQKAFADKELKITIPRRSHLTPVQKLNREGVAEIEKHQYARAEAAFMKAYLYDSSDPFTLYNLGYAAELQGNLDRAQKFYGLAVEQATDATIDRTNVRSLKGQPMRKAALGIEDRELRVNQANIDAIRLLESGQPREAEFVLTQTLQRDPQNPFTLNNLGVAQEAQGNFAEAEKSYQQAASIHSSPTSVVTSTSPAWRGKPVSEVARANGAAVEQRLKSASTAQAQASLLNVQGVAAMNRNDWNTASQDFQKAYSLDPRSAFSLNNEGFLAETNGDSETAQFFYERAKLAQDSSAAVGLATHRDAEGSNVASAATGSSRQVGTKLSVLEQERRKENIPVVLRNRDNSPVVEPPPSPSATPQ